MKLQKRMRRFQPLYQVGCLRVSPEAMRGRISLGKQQTGRSQRQRSLMTSLNAERIKDTASHQKRFLSLPAKT